MAPLPADPQHDWSRAASQGEASSPLGGRSGEVHPMSVRCTEGALFASPRRSRD